MIKANSVLTANPIYINKIFELKKYKGMLFEGYGDLSGAIFKEFNIDINPKQIARFFNTHKINPKIRTIIKSYKCVLIGMDKDIEQYAKINQIPNKGD